MRAACALERHRPTQHTLAPTPTHPRRYYDANGRAPLFEFGFGLSFSNVSFSGLRVEGAVTAAGGNATVHAQLALTGGPAGAAVAQLYARYPASCDGEPLRLVSFAKAELTPGAPTRALTFTLRASDLRVFNVATDAFELCPGTYTLYLAASSRDFREHVVFPVARG